MLLLVCACIHRPGAFATPQARNDFINMCAEHHQLAKAMMACSEAERARWTIVDLETYALPPVAPSVLAAPSVDETCAARILARLKRSMKEHTGQAMEPKPTTAILFQTSAPGAHQVWIPSLSHNRNIWAIEACTGRVSESLNE